MNANNKNHDNDRAEAMQAFLEQIRASGGFAKRVLESGVITTEQLDRFRQNLVVEVHV